MNTHGGRVQPKVNTDVWRALACPSRARSGGQDRYLGGTHGHSVMAADLQRAGHWGMTIQFPS